jgi:hypothetical protein
MSDYYFFKIHYVIWPIILILFVYGLSSITSKFAEHINEFYIVTLLFLIIMSFDINYTLPFFS